MAAWRRRCPRPTAWERRIFCGARDRSSMRPVWRLRKGRCRVGLKYDRARRRRCSATSRFEGDSVWTESVRQCQCCAAVHVVQRRDKRTAGGGFVAMQHLTLSARQRRVVRARHDVAAFRARHRGTVERDMLPVTAEGGIALSDSCAARCLVTFAYPSAHFHSEVICQGRYKRTFLRRAATMGARLSQTKARTPGAVATLRMRRAATDS